VTAGEPSFGSPPTWLPGGRRGESARAWWRDLMRAVEALRERYPRALADLPVRWWRAADLSEQLGAVCAWRLDLDAGRSVDPREELAFHEALERLQERLERQTRASLLEGTAGTRGATNGREAPVRALEEDLQALPDEPDVSLDRAFFAPNEGRPDSPSDRAGPCA